MIGITCYVEQARFGPWDVRAALVPYVYVEKVQTAGGRAVVLPPDALDADVLDRLDGLLIAGGADVDARLYGASRDETADEPRVDRDEGELTLYRAARARAMPVLGVCRGLQVMAVAHGGTLHQDLPAVVGSTVHREAKGEYSLHAANLTDGSLVATLLGTTSIEVNSSHHQAVDSPGGLTVTGWAQDGTVEVCEDSSAPFVLGVQWHPEVLDDLRLFEGLVTAATA